MADTVTSKVLREDGVNYVAVFTNISDGTGENAVTKIDVSALRIPASEVYIEKVWYSCYGMSVSILFDATTDDKMLVLQGDGFMDFTSIGGITNPHSAGWNGDVLFTTNGHTASDTYTIVLACKIVPAK